MRIKNINITGLALFQKGINIDLARVNAIIGDNASGKTYLLNVIAFILDFLNGEPINDIKTKTILNNSDKIDISVTFISDKEYKIESEIIRKDDIYVRYVINKESFFVKKDKFVLVRERKENEYLKNDCSISFFLNNKARFYFKKDEDNLINLRFFSSFIKLFDKSIEKISFTNDLIKSKIFNQDLIKLKFFNQKEIITNLTGLSDYLSNGTLKGVNTFINACLVNKNKGYFLIDDLECCLNKRMMKELINSFDEANFIFTTNYLEFVSEEKIKTFLVENKEDIILI